MTERHPTDHYPTPKEAITPLLDALGPHIEPVKFVLDPGCGSGNLGAAVRERWPGAYIGGVEIDEALALWSMKSGIYDGVAPLDFLEMVPDFGGHPGYDFIITNPPFSLAQQFVTRIFDHWATPDSTVAVLLRLNFLASRKRRDWWRSLPTPRLMVLSERPSFTGDKNTDMTDYAWYVFGAPDAVPAISWL